MGSRPLAYHTTDAQTALTVFDLGFMQAYRGDGIVPWATEFGYVLRKDVLKVEFPIPISSAGYSDEFKGDPKFRSLSEKSFSFETKTYQDGVEEFAKKIEANDWIGFAAEPEAMGLAAKQAPNKWVEDLLAAGESTLGWDGVNFFSASHPVNYFKPAGSTFSNLHTTMALNLANLAKGKERIRKLKKPNGKEPLGLRATHLRVGPGQEELARDLLERSLVVESNAAVDNRHKGSLKLIVSDEMSSDTDWDLIALNKPGMYPWVIQLANGGDPRRLILGKESDLYKLTGKVAFNTFLDGAAALGMPACIHRFKA